MSQVFLCKKCGRAIPERRLKNTKRGVPLFCSDRHQIAYRVARFRNRAPQNRQDAIHLRNLAAHGMVAEKLLRDPTLLEEVIGTLSRWSASHGQTPVMAEWKKILETRDLHAILATLLAVDENGMRLRSSSPFAGLLNDTERSLIHKAPTK